MRKRERDHLVSDPELPAPKRTNENAQTENQEDVLLPRMLFSLFYTSSKIRQAKYIFAPLHEAQSICHGEHGDHSLEYHPTKQKTLQEKING
jgi:hypothetical protein